MNLAVNATPPVTDAMLSQGHGPEALARLEIGRTFEERLDLHETLVKRIRSMHLIALTPAASVA